MIDSNENTLIARLGRFSVVLSSFSFKVFVN